jgi:hypothetical protein
MDQGQVLFEGVRILLDLLGHKDWSLQILRLKEALAMRCEARIASKVVLTKLRDSSG